MLRAKYFCLQVLQILPGIGFKKKSETGERPPHPPQFIHVTILLVLTHIYKMKWTGEAFIHPIITPNTARSDPWSKHILIFCKYILFHFWEVVSKFESLSKGILNLLRVTGLFGDWKNIIHSTWKLGMVFLNLPSCKYRAWRISKGLRVSYWVIPLKPHVITVLKSPAEPLPPVRAEHPVRSPETSKTLHEAKCL